MNKQRTGGNTGGNVVFYFRREVQHLSP